MVEDIIPFAEFRYVPAGAITFGVIHREFTEESMAPYVGRPGVDEILAKIREEGFYDRGPSVYVNDTDNGRDYLRFDCQEREPHYHYHHLYALEDAGVPITMDYQKIIGQADNVTMNGHWHQVTFDSAANGDMREWVMDKLDRRLAEMLIQAGVPALAAKLDMGLIRSVLPEVRRLVFARAV
jgi:hypothetical protein